MSAYNSAYNSAVSSSFKSTDNGAFHPTVPATELGSYNAANETTINAAF